MSFRLFKIEFVEDIEGRRGGVLSSNNNRLLRFGEVTTAGALVLMVVYSTVLTVLRVCECTILGVSYFSLP
jgi:hypothetical protein